MKQNSKSKKPLHKLILPIKWNLPKKNKKPCNLIVVPKIKDGNLEINFKPITKPINAITGLIIPIKDQKILTYLEAELKMAEKAKT